MCRMNKRGRIAEGGALLRGHATMWKCNAHGPQMLRRRRCLAGTTATTAICHRRHLPAGDGGIGFAWAFNEQVEGGRLPTGTESAPSCLHAPAVAANIEESPFG
jgi:hypothetical protein